MSSGQHREYDERTGTEGWAREYPDGSKEVYPDQDHPYGHYVERRYLGGTYREYDDGTSEKVDGGK